MSAFNRQRASLRAWRAGGTFVALLIAALFQAMTVSANAAPTRIVSLNLCTDQLVLALADTTQIAGLSPYARDPELSFMAAAAVGVPVLSGGAEDVFMLSPDLIVGGRFSGRATREILRAKGLAVTEFDSASSIDDVRGQIVRMGDLVGQPDRAAAAVARIDAAIERLRAGASRSSRRVLAISRRGWAPGHETLTTSLLNAAGLANAASDLGFRSGGFASLEQIIRLRPDLIMESGDDVPAEDQGQAFLLHPALQRLYPLDRRIIVPERLTVCGGPMLADALDLLAQSIGRLAP
jgi:iron complex transport system substrate-binding protein